MSQHHQLYNSEILKINCNNQAIEIIKQFKLHGVVIEEHFERYMHVRIIFRNGYVTLKILKKLKRYTSYQRRIHVVNPPCWQKLITVMFYLKDR